MHRHAAVRRLSACGFMRIGLDFDGTLVSCEERHVAVLAHVAQAAAVGLDASSIWSLKREGMSTQDALRVAGLDLVASGTLAHAWMSQIEQLQWLGFDRLICRADALIEARRRGDTLHLITARCNAGHLRAQLTRLGLDDCFDTVDIVGTSDVAAAKCAALSQRLCTRFIGDTEADCAAALAAGVRFVGVSSGMRTERYLRSAGADDVAPDVNHFLEDYARRDFET